MIIFFALINCIVVPFEIAVETDYAKTFEYKAANYALDIVFFLDIFVRLNTSLEVNSVEIRDRSIITRKYLKGQFTIDVLSVLPVELISTIFLPEFSS